MHIHTPRTRIPSPRRRTKSNTTYNYRLNNCNTKPHNNNPDIIPCNKNTIPSHRKNDGLDSNNNNNILAFTKSGIKKMDIHNFLSLWNAWDHNIQLQHHSTIPPITNRTLRRFNTNKLNQHNLKNPKTKNNKNKTNKKRINKTNNTNTHNFSPMLPPPRTWKQSSCNHIIQSDKKNLHKRISNPIRLHKHINNSNIIHNTLSNQQNTNRCRKCNFPNNNHNSTTAHNNFIHNSNHNTNCIFNNIANFKNNSKPYPQNQLQIHINNHSFLFNNHHFHNNKPPRNNHLHNCNNPRTINH